MIPDKVLRAHYETLEKIMLNLAQYTLDKEEINMSFRTGDIKILINGRYEDNN